jgi:NAD(P)-dependent dehydrogenase (short-subunit alcohol dehydrogenase family)
VVVADISKEAAERVAGEVGDRAAATTGDVSDEDDARSMVERVLACMRHELPAMLANGGGSIVNMASILGSVGLAQSCAYVAAKHGVVGPTRSAASAAPTRSPPWSPSWPRTRRRS